MKDIDFDVANEVPNYELVTVEQPEYRVSLVMLSTDLWLLFNDEDGIELDIPLTPEKAYEFADVINKWRQWREQPTRPNEELVNVDELELPGMWEKADFTGGNDG